MNIPFAKFSLVLLTMILMSAVPGSVAAGSPPSAIKFALKFPSDVTINLQPPVQNGGRTPVSATLTLSNTSRSDITLTASNACMSHTWTVTDDANHKIVDTSGVCEMVVLPVHLKIDAGQSFSENRDVVLAGTKYSDGKTYTLRYRYWGYTKTAKFTVKVVQ